MHRKPLLEIMNPSGLNILPKLGGLWLGAKVTDKAGRESDSATLVCIGPPSRFTLPKRGDVYTILMGWEDEGLILQGQFSFQKAAASGSPERGDVITLQFRAADYVDALKKEGREHFEEGTTFGDLMKKVAKAAGLEAQVDPDLAKLKLGYRVRWDQSLIDFATEVGAELGATVKPAGGKLIAIKRGGGKSAGGSDLEPILIRRDQCLGYSVEIDPRPEAGKVAASWQDKKTGARKVAKASTGLDGPTCTLPHPYRSEDEATRAAEAEGYERVNASGSGWFELPGLPRARAEAPVTVLGFGPPIDGAWKAEGVEKAIDVRGGFITTVSVAAGKDKKGSKGT